MSLKKMCVGQGKATVSVKVKLNAVMELKNVSHPSIYPPCPSDLIAKGKCKVEKSTLGCKEVDLNQDAPHYQASPSEEQDI